MSFLRTSGARYACCLAGCWLAIVANQAAAPPVLGQQGQPAQVTPAAPAPAKVAVKPEARDEEIRDRLLGILHATGWFIKPTVSVNEGIVFLDGQATDERHRQWAENLASNTQGVVEVVNRLDVVTLQTWDFSPAWTELQSVARNVLVSLPLLLVALIVMVLAWIVARLVSRLLRQMFRTRISSRLLREVAARTCGVLVFLIGLYLVLRVSGLTRLAITVVGGTGLVGLVLGIAFRDITENFLASLLLSMHHPFREGDLVEISGTTGYVKQLTSRATLLMTLDGNQVQIPNSTVFKSSIRNFTSNANRREDFVVGIGYDARIPHAQEIALKVLADHPAVLADPEPWVLVDSLAPATVNLRIYFWLNGQQHSWLKVRSSVIRLIKRAFQDQGISLPDEAREVVFPEGVPVRMLAEPPRDGQPPPRQAAAPEAEAVATDAEAGLESEARQIDAQARGAWMPGDGENLLAGDKNPSARPG